MGVGERVGKLLFRPFVDRFVAGPTPEEAIATVRSLNREGIGGIVSSLGEHVHREEAAREGVREYRQLLDMLAKEDLDGCISVKPTHMGLEIDRDLAEANLLELTEQARERDLFVWVDMERSTFTDATLDLYESMLATWERTGVCLQANLRRTPSDLERVVDAGGKIRLVKGAYDEPATIAYRDKARIDRAFGELMSTLFETADGFAVATHDEALIEQAKRLGGVHDPDWELQMLFGVRDDLKPALVDEGHRLLTYIPYGREWFPYYWRRIQERRENLWFAVKAVLGR